MPNWMQSFIFALNIIDSINIMEVVTARQFRSNQGKFLTAAKNGQTVLLMSRYGAFKIRPVADSDQIVEDSIRASIAEVKAHLEGRKNLPDARDIVF